jgi:8-oxo-dGTP pyrophosphatase MutT (NUDIX family)
MSKISHDSETPAHGQQVITPTAFIHRIVNGKACVFMAKRAATKKFLPGVYEIPGGHVEFGEDIARTHPRIPFLLQITSSGPVCQFGFAMYLDTSCRQNCQLAPLEDGFRT